MYIFGNGNIKYSDFEYLYLTPIRRLITEEEPEFIICDFRGVDVLAMEFLKSETPKVTLLHIGEKPRYMPDSYKTKVSQWEMIGGFTDDHSRDEYAIKICTHFIATDFNSNEKRKSGTWQNIERCEALGKIQLSIHSL